MLYHQLRGLFVAGGVAAVALLCAPAFSADMPMKAPTPPSPVLNWTGFYVGGDIGYLWGRTDYVLATNGFTAETKPHGVLGGGHAGYNWQWSNWVTGFEGDFLESDAKGSNSIAAPDVEKIRWTSSARLRAGYTNGSYLLYATGGAAWVDLDHQRPTNLPPTGARATLSGWTAGVGLEALISKNWSARLEYRYTDYNRHNFPTPTIATASDLLEKVRTQQILLGVSYKFDWGKFPVVAKY
jgi:outer membrane immunogenic protein